MDMLNFMVLVYNIHINASEQQENDSKEKDTALFISV